MNHIILVWIGRVLGGLVGLILLLVVAGVIYQAIGNARDKRRIQPPGTLVDVGGYRLHLLCSGEGGPTVVMEAMGPGWSLNWCLVQPEVAKFTRVCAYDRAGYGWSDPGPAPRTARKVVEELRTALKKSGLPGPYVLVGHSGGGFTARIFHDQFPDEVAGIVLVDASHQDQLTYPEHRAYYEWVKRQLSLAPLVSALGLIRLSVASGTVPPYILNGRLDRLPPDVRPMMLATWLQSRTWKTMADESDAFPENIAQLGATGTLGDMPLVVLTATGPEWLPGLPPGSPINEQFLQQWMTMQRDLVTLSSNSSQVFAEKSSHLIPLDEPELVVAAIRHVVEAVRQQGK